MCVALALLVVGCASSGSSARPLVYDLGPEALVADSPAPLTTPPTTASLPALLVAEVTTPVALDSPAVLYRLRYANEQQLQPYAQARWSMPPAQLLQQRVRQYLGQQRPVFTPDEASVAMSASAWMLRLELEEFSQTFTTPTQSNALLRTRATVSRLTPKGEVLLGQRRFTTSREAPSADAAGGVRAMRQALDATVVELDQWLKALPAP